MRWPQSSGSRLLSAASALLLITNIAVGVNAVEKGQAEGAWDLTGENFKQETSRGAWLVEHFSPFCGHCRSFAPTFERLVKDHKYLEGTRGFHLAQVNCIASGDLCNENEIKYYPMIKLYVDGEEKDIFKAERSYEKLSEYIEEHSLQYIKEHGQKKAKEASSFATIDNIPNALDATVSADAPNPEGEVVELSPDSFKQMVAQGPAFIEFYAPCCQRLAPKYAEFGKAMRGKLAVGKVNCDDNKSLCKKHNVMGYPTLKIFHNGQPSEYMGERTIEGMTSFSRQTIEKGQVRHISLEGWKKSIEEHETSFLLLQTYGSDPAIQKSFEEALAALDEPVAAFTSLDPEIFREIPVDPTHGTVLLVFKDNGSMPVNRQHITSGWDTARLQKHFEAHRMPLVQELTKRNYDSLFKSPSRALLVLAALRRDDKNFDKQLQEFKSMARAWSKGGRNFEQPVWFVWADAKSWKRWLKHAYGKSKSDAPSLVLVDPPLNEYYDTTIERKPLTFDGTRLFSTLEGAFQHAVQPKFSETVLQRSSKGLSALYTVSADHPILTIMLLSSAFVAATFVISKCLPGGNAVPPPYPAKGGLLDSRLD